MAQLFMTSSDLERSNGGQANGGQGRNLETLADTAKCIIYDG